MRLEDSVGYGVIIGVGNGVCIGVYCWSKDLKYGLCMNFDVSVGWGVD